MGVCCIVFDIDGMLFEIFMNFLNIEKNKISKFHGFFMLYAISRLSVRLSVCLSVCPSH